MQHTHLFTPDCGPMTASTDTMEVQFGEPQSFIGFTFQRMGKELLTGAEMTQRQLYYQSPPNHGWAHTKLGAKYTAQLQEVDGLSLSCLFQAAGLVSDSSVQLDSSRRDSQQSFLFTLGREEPSDYSVSGTCWSYFKLFTLCLERVFLKDGVFHLAPECPHFPLQPVSQEVSFQVGRFESGRKNCYTATLEIPDKMFVLSLLEALKSQNSEDCWHLMSLQSSPVAVLQVCSVSLSLPYHDLFIFCLFRVKFLLSSSSGLELTR